MTKARAGFTECRIERESALEKRRRVARSLLTQHGQAEIVLVLRGGRIAAYRLAKGGLGTGKIAGSAERLAERVPIRSSRRVDCDRLAQEADGSGQIALIAMQLSEPHERQRIVGRQLQQGFVGLDRFRHVAQLAPHGCFVLVHQRIARGDRSSSLQRRKRTLRISHGDPRVGERAIRRPERRKPFDRFCKMAFCLAMSLETRQTASQVVVHLEAVDTLLVELPEPRHASGKVLPLQP